MRLKNTFKGCTNVCNLFVFDTKGGGDTTMKITSTINMDLARQGIKHQIDAVQDDKYSRNLKLQLYSNRVAWRIPSGTTVLIRYRKSDHTGGAYDTLPDGTIAWQIKGNTVTVALAPQVLTVAGEVQVMVTLIAGKSEISTFSIIINVQRKPGFRAESETYEKITGFLPMPMGNATAGQFLEISEVDEKGAVKALRPVPAPTNSVLTVNGVNPDQNGNVNIEIENSGLPIPETAVVGQYIRVSSIDANGKVTSVEAVDAEILIDAEEGRF